MMDTSIILAVLFAGLFVTLLVSIRYPRWAYDNNAGLWFVFLVFATSIYLGVTSYVNVFGV